jgi:hypothetical protein
MEPAVSERSCNEHCVMIMCIVCAGRIMDVRLFASLLMLVK